MPLGDHISLIDKGAIVALSKSGLSVRTIAKKVGHHFSSIGRRVEKNRTYGLETSHAGIPQQALRINAEANAGCHSGAGWSHQILIHSNS